MYIKIVILIKVSKVILNIQIIQDIISGGEFMTRPEGKHAWTAKVGEKGQIVIPKEARDIFNIKPGDTLLLLGDEAEGIAIMKSDMYKDLIQKVFGEQDRKEEE